VQEILTFLSALAALVNKFGIWVVLIATVIGVFVFRFDKIWSAFGLVFAKVFPVWAEARKLKMERRRQELAQTRLREQAEWEQESSFNQAIQHRMLQNGEQKTALYEKQIADLKEQLATERHERIMAQNSSSEFQMTLKELEIRTIEITTDALDVARTYADRLDPICEAVVAHRKEASALSGELNIKLEALGFVIAQLAFRGQKGKAFEDLVNDLKRVKSQAPDSKESS
jgi:hypothetical protein